MYLKEVPCLNKVTLPYYIVNRRDSESHFVNTKVYKAIFFIDVNVNAKKYY